jgi:hypothetical protein
MASLGLKLACLDVLEMIQNIPSCGQLFFAQVAHARFVIHLHHDPPRAAKQIFRG